MPITAIHPIPPDAAALNDAIAHVARYVLARQNQNSVGGSEPAATVAGLPDRAVTAGSELPTCAEQGRGLLALPALPVLRECE